MEKLTTSQLLGLLLLKRQEDTLNNRGLQEHEHASRLEADFIGSLTNLEKVELRQLMEAKKLPMMKSLFYDYQTQKWI